MPAAERFNFDLNFDGPPPDEVDAMPDTADRAKPEEPTFSESEIKAAEQSGFAAGHAKGLEEGRSAASAELQGGLEKSMSATLDAINGQLTQIAAMQGALRERFERDAIEVACAIAKKTTSRIVRDAATQMIEAVVQEVLPRLLDEPRIAIRVADEILDGLTARLGELKTQTGFEGEFIIVSDPDLETANCRIEWADGGADVSYDRVWSEIDAVIEEFLGAAGTPEDPPAPQHGPDEPAQEADAPATPVEDTNHEA